MTSGPNIDGVLVQWGERLFYPRNRIVKPMPPARLDALTQRKAAVVRRRIVATVSRRVPQVMVDRKSTRLNSSHGKLSRMPSSA